jgi:hypothetical protein
MKQEYRILKKLSLAEGVLQVMKEIQTKKDLVHLIKICNKL